MPTSQTTFAKRSSAAPLIPLGLVGFVLAVSGCNEGQEAQFNWPDWARPDRAESTTTQPAVPEPVDLLLPHSLRIHPFTGTRTFDETGGVRGIEVRLEALDAFGDSTKAFGDFRFELYAYHPDQPDHRGRQINIWDISLSEPRSNAIHWDKVHRNYLFKLRWDEPMQVGRRFVLGAVFTSPFTDRLFAQRIFTAGE